MSDGEASTLPLSRSDRSLVCSSCRHHSRQREEEELHCSYHSNDFQHLQGGLYAGFCCTKLMPLICLLKFENFGGV